MKLKSIDLHGFKSFSDKTKIQLNDGISCVVGPNGSGKSNIADAVRWVLGEQSAKSLRGQKMEDVIFSGSGKRKPVGMAEVVLNIDNGDGSLPVEFTEVAICRRAYRSGESEYFVNGTQCRLRDIQDMFLDSGISNNSLCMVGQGRVQQIVDMKPEERRALIEEAAGVIKYRNRKKTAVRKLGDTEKNLERIWDIISELSDRLEPLYEQKIKAEKYIELKEKADNREINLLIRILKENKAEIDKINEKIKLQGDEILTDNNRFVIVNDEIEVKKIGLAETEQMQNQIQRQLFTLKTDKEKSTANENLLGEKLKTAQENVTRIQGEIELILNRDDGFIRQAEKLEKECSEKQLLKDELFVRINKQNELILSRKKFLEDLNGTIELSRDELFNLAGELANSKNMLNNQFREIADNKQRIDDIRKAKIALKDEKTSLGGQIAGLENKLAENGRQLKANRDKSAEVQNQIAVLAENITMLTENEVKTRMKLNSDQSRLKVLKEVAENHEGFYPGVRALLQAKKQNKSVGKNILGTVADLIDFDKKYAVALEAALASSMQNLVVKSDDDAKYAVAYLKENNSGRATFLPVENLVVKIKKELDNAVEQTGVIGRMSDVVECESSVRTAVDFLLSNILMVESLDIATKIARENRQSFKIITLDGDVISPGGVISGGSRKKNSGDILMKKAQLKELEKSVKVQTEQHEKILNELAALREKNETLLKEQDNLLSVLRYTEIDKIALEKDYNYLKDFAANKNRQEELFENDLRQLNSEQEHLIKRRAEIEKSIANWEADNIKANENIRELQKKFEIKSSELEVMQHEAEALKLDFVKKEQEYNALHNESERLRIEKSDLFRQEADKRQALENWREQLKNIVELKKENKEKILYLSENIQSKEAEYRKISNFTESEKAIIKKLEKESAELNRKLTLSRNEFHQTEIKLTKLQTEWDNGNQKLAETFEMSYEDALSYFDPTVAVSTLAKSVRELRKEIAGLGNVNLDSVEEYNEVYNRYEFLTTQRNDLLKAKDSLRAVIREMDSIVIRRFKKAFDDVNTEFNITFNKLFGGGSAGLVMTIPNDILETGVDMIVQPPGKKLVNYNLLSGGEKSLIGIALILAVFHVKPSPFCVLDEVDAALDEANVGRFAQYLKEYTNHTQFLVVTHRQGTMEAASSLWGVTMAADGVSEVVSVKLSDMTANQFV